METKVKETLPVREGSAQTPSHLVRPSVWTRAKVLGVRVLAAAFPQFPIPGYCSSCWARLALVGDLPVDGGEPYLVQGVRFWRCPRCGHGASIRYEYSWMEDHTLWG